MIDYKVSDLYKILIFIVSKNLQRLKEPPNILSNWLKMNEWTFHFANILIFLRRILLKVTWIVYILEYIHLNNKMDEKLQRDRKK